MPFISTAGSKCQAKTPRPPYINSFFATNQKKDKR